LIQHYEDCKLEAYQDSVGVWTIGYGSTFYPDGKPVKKGDTITQDESDRLFEGTIEGLSKQVNGLLPHVFLKDCQFDALMSFAYILGVNSLKNSTLLKKVRVNQKDPTIGYEFSKWIYAGKSVLKGLVNRRKSESLLYSTGTLEFFYV